MKRKLLFLFCLLGWQINAQFVSFTEEPLTSVDGIPYDNKPQPKFLGGVAIADFDNNGYIDLVTTGASGYSQGTNPVEVVETHLHLNNGDRTFTVTQPFVNIGGNPPIVLDINNDGHVDVLISGYTTSYVMSADEWRNFIYWGHGDGTFTEQEIYFPLDRFWLELRPCDLDNNGKLDLVVFAYEGMSSGFYDIAQIHILNINNDGTFTEVGETGLPEEMRWPEVYTDDFNGDGLPEVFITPYGNSQSNGGHMMFFENQGSFQFVEIPEPRRFENGTTTTLPAWEQYSMSSGDINGDGLMDFHVSGFYNGDWGNPLGQTYINNGDGTFTLDQILYGMRSDPSVLYDFNEDGFPEILTKSGIFYNSEGNYDFENNFSSFPLVRGIITGKSRDVVIYDFDNDGDSDILYIGNNQLIAQGYVWWNNTHNMSIIDANISEVKIYPNPTRDIINFSERVKEITVYDLSGKLMSAQKTITNKLDISFLSKGSYIIKGITEAGKKFTNKIVLK